MNFLCVSFASQDSKRLHLTKTSTWLWSRSLLLRVFQTNRQPKEEDIQCHNQVLRKSYWRTLLILFVIIDKSLVACCLSSRGQSDSHSATRRRGRRRGRRRRKKKEERKHPSLDINEIKTTGKRGMRKAMRDGLSVICVVYFSVFSRWAEDIQPEEKEGRSWWRCCCCLLVPLYSVSVCCCPTLAHLLLIPPLGSSQRSRRILLQCFGSNKSLKLFHLSWIL